jgi:hypothetical protein
MTRCFLRHDLGDSGMPVKTESDKVWGSFDF